MNSDIKILQSKLKRNNIPCKIDGSRITIGKAKIDIITVILILLLLATIPILIYLSLIDFRLKFVIIGLIFISSALYYLKRLAINYRANNKVKILHNHQLSMNNLNFDSTNIESIFAKIEEIKEDEEYQGELYIKDNKEQETLIIQVVEPNEQLINNEINWLINFFSSYLNVKS